MQKLVQALPQFQDQLDKLSLHIHVRAKLEIGKSVFLKILVRTKVCCCHLFE